ncbi:dehydrodolichyl diphosphate synthase complex subunit nus1 [Scyliorhinus canicula]|uniref:dehydrodolichyl diphosphate synthase complex subunit nus1 n=1 Tax=Scyliorhinus canicula TaxID=7830 RepID=UPI0018F69183|nr:dehydrodolichyl diphosphate synthase complex subunit nus1 [Scyliorhinus canicula]
MALFELVWRVLHTVLCLHRTLSAWLRNGMWAWKRWNPASLAFGFQNAKNKGKSRRARWRSHGRSLKKLPLHLGLVVTEEESSYTDIANLVVWCMAVGISYVSVYDNQGEAVYEYYFKNNCKYGCITPSIFVQVHETWASQFDSVVTFSTESCGFKPLIFESTVQTDFSVWYFVKNERKSLPDVYAQAFLCDGLLNFPPSFSTSRSLPSHINLSYERFISALRQFAACEQRMGK